MIFVRILAAAITWGVRLVLFTILAILVILIGAGVARQVHRGRDERQPMALVCEPCHDKHGRCLCEYRCGHPDCIGDHTTFSIREVAELEQMLDREGGRD